MKRFFFLFLFAALATPVFAQPAFKIAYLNVDSLLDIMPEFQAATDSAQQYYAKLEKQLYDMQVKLEEMTVAYDESSTKDSPEKRKQQEDAIAAYQKQIAAFQDSAKANFDAYRAGLVKPIFDKVLAAAEKVAKKKGYAYVLDSSESAALVVFAAPAYNIFDDVCKELGIKNTSTPAKR